LLLQTYVVIGPHEHVLCRDEILCVRLSTGKTVMQWPSFRTRYCTIDI